MPTGVPAVAPTVAVKVTALCIRTGLMLALTLTVAAARVTASLAIAAVLVEFSGMDAV